MNEENNYDATVKVSTITKFMVFLGIIFIISSKIGLSYINKKLLPLVVILQVIDALGTTLFSAGLVSVIVEISTINNIVKKAFERFLKGDFELDGMSQKTLMKLKNDISLKLLNLEKKDLSNSPYKYEQKLLNMVNEKYYKHHNITYHITPDENNKCFHVKAKIDYQIINKNLIDNCFLFKLKVYKFEGNTPEEKRIKHKGKGLGNINNFNCTVKINNELINNDEIITVEDVTHITESKYYDYKITLSKNLQGEKNKIQAEINYDVPIFDICQSFKISSPCKNIEHKFYIERDCATNEEWVISANAYSTFYHRQDEEESNYKVEQNIDQALTIRFQNWALVGNGYCVFYQKKVDFM